MFGLSGRVCIFFFFVLLSLALPICALVSLCCWMATESEVSLMCNARRVWQCCFIFSFSILMMLLFRIHQIHNNNSLTWYCLIYFDLRDLLQIYRSSIFQMNFIDFNKYRLNFVWRRELNFQNTRKTTTTTEDNKKKNNCKSTAGWFCMNTVVGAWCCSRGWVSVAVCVLATALGCIGNVCSSGEQKYRKKT